MTDLGMIEAFKESNIIRHSQNLLLGIQRLLLREAFSPSVVFYFFMFFVFSGVIRGLAPLIVLSVIPEIFYRESKFLLFLWFLNAFGPRLESRRGDE